MNVLLPFFGLTAVAIFAFEVYVSFFGDYAKRHRERIQERDMSMNGRCVEAAVPYGFCVSFRISDVRYSRRTNGGLCHCAYLFAATKCCTHHRKP